MPHWDIEFILAGVGGFLAVLFWLGRRSSVLRPTPLNLKARPRISEESSLASVPSRAPFRPASSGRSFSDKPGVRILNVVFVWNGHPWDAFEVLGVPAGSHLAAVEKSYQDLLLKTDAQSKAFLDAAYAAIVEEFQRSA